MPKYFAPTVVLFTNDFVLWLMKNQSPEDSGDKFRILFRWIIFSLAHLHQQLRYARHSCLCCCRKFPATCPAISLRCQIHRIIILFTVFATHSKFRLQNQIKFMEIKSLKFFQLTAVDWWLLRRYLFAQPTACDFQLLFSACNHSNALRLRSRVAISSFVRSFVIIVILFRLATVNVLSAVRDVCTVHHFQC